MADRDDSKETTEEDLRAVTIGELRSLNGPIVLSEYDPEWPLAYAREAERIRSLLGEELALLEHVGSTSVVGLPAKPIIDILLGVPDSSDEGAYVPQLERGGYVLRVREPDWYEHRVLKGPNTAVNLHVFSMGCVEIERMLRFRDWLRQSSRDRERYASSKRVLARRTWKFVQNYADAKSEVVQEILKASLANAQ